MATHKKSDLLKNIRFATRTACSIGLDVVIKMRMKATHAVLTFGGRGKKNIAVTVSANPNIRADIVKNIHNEFARYNYQ